MDKMQHDIQHIIHCRGCIQVDAVHVIPDSVSLAKQQNFTVVTMYVSAAYTVSYTHASATASRLPGPDACSARSSWKSAVQPSNSINSRIPSSHSPWYRASLMLLSRRKLKSPTTSRLIKSRGQVAGTSCGKLANGETERLVPMTMARSALHRSLLQCLKNRSGSGSPKKTMSAYHTPCHGNLV